MPASGRSEAARWRHPFQVEPLRAAIRALMRGFGSLHKDHPHGLGAQRFADVVAERSGSALKVRDVCSGQLGGDAQVISSLRGSTVEMTMVSPGLHAR